MPPLDISNVFDYEIDTTKESEDSDFEDDISLLSIDNESFDEEVNHVAELANENTPSGRYVNEDVGERRNRVRRRLFVDDSQWSDSEQE